MWRSRLGAAGAIARFAGEDCSTFGADPLAATVAANAGAVGATAIAAVTAADAFFLRAGSRRPLTASSRRRRERTSDFSHTSIEARSLCGASILGLSFVLFLPAAYGVS